MYLCFPSPNSYFPRHLSYSVVPYNNFSSSYSMEAIRGLSLAAVQLKKLKASFSVFMCSLVSQLPQGKKLKLSFA